MALIQTTSLELQQQKLLKLVNSTEVTKVAHHDICYVKNKEAKTRNEVCDKNMLTELNGIYNPTLRERMERGVVSAIIGTKKTLWMGVKKTTQHGLTS